MKWLRDADSIELSTLKLLVYQEWPTKLLAKTLTMLTENDAVWCGETVWWSKIVGKNLPKLQFKIKLKQWHIKELNT